MQSFVFSTTSSGLPICGFKFGDSGPRVLVLGGVHGDEIEGVWAAYGLLGRLTAEPSQRLEFKLQLTLVPAFNLDGVLTRERRNARMVDLNRNLPTKDWSPLIATERYHPGPSAASEAENHGLIRYIQSERPEFILSLHSWKPLLNPNGNCSPEIEVIAKETGYKIQPDMGYPTPGSLGSWGNELGIPILTYEIERGLDRESVLSVHLPAICMGLRASESRTFRVTGDRS